MDVWDNIRRIVRAAAADALQPAADALAEECRRRVSVPGHGVPSAPGEPPRMQTGELRRSIRSEVDRSSLKVYVVAEAPYAFYLEYGTDRMRPRPFMRPALVAFGERAAVFVADHMGGGHGARMGARHAPGELLEGPPDAD